MSEVTQLYPTCSNHLYVYNVCILYTFVSLVSSMKRVNIRILVWQGELHFFYCDVINSDLLAFYRHDLIIFFKITIDKIIKNKHQQLYK